MNIKVKITRDENADFFNVSVGDIVELDFETYVATVVASEIGNSDLEACKAQAVASRTFAMRYIDGVISDSSKSAQAYRAIRHDTSKYPNAVAGTRMTVGEVLLFKNKPITAVFSSNNGGTTVSSKERWGTNYAYLISQKDEWDDSTKRTGHGVGMSQRGIKNAAKLGVKYKDMLNFYYPGTTLAENYGKKEEKEDTVKVPKFLLNELARIIKEITK